MPNALIFGVKSAILRHQVGAARVLFGMWRSAKKAAVIIILDIVLLHSGARSGMV